MATSNIQEKGLEKSIYFIEGVDDYDEQFNDLKLNLECEKIPEVVLVYDRGYKEWVELSFTIRIAPCYYDGANLIIICDNELSDFDFSKTSEIKIKKAIDKLEKICKDYSTEIKCVGSFSNGEAIYKKV